MQKKIVVGISGGVDSAVTAAIFKEQGFEVFGLHLNISDNQEDVSDILQKIKATLDISISTLDVRGEFNNIVIQHFRSEHLKGFSPSPCAYCNPTFKWRLLEDYASKVGADHIASGHYIQTIQQKGMWWVKKGVDPKKDQSYYLWGLSQDILSKIETPLGLRNKTETVELTKKYGLDFLKKKGESTGLCFSGGLSYPELIQKHIPEANNIPHGEVVDEKGKIIGKHRGYIYYTIGQKRDLELHSTEKLCVIDIDAESNTLIAGDPKKLWKDRFFIRNHHFTDLDAALSNNKIEVKVRGFGWNPDGFGTLIHNKNNSITVKLENPAWATAPGQPAVFYSEDLLLGGGIINLS